MNRKQLRLMELDNKNKLLIPITLNPKTLNDYTSGNKEIECNQLFKKKRKWPSVKNWVEIVKFNEAKFERSPSVNLQNYYSSEFEYPSEIINSNLIKTPHRSELKNEGSGILSSNVNKHIKNSVIQKLEFSDRSIKLLDEEEEKVPNF